MLFRSVVAAAEKLFVQVFIPFGGGARRSSAAEHLRLACSWFLGSARRARPRPDSAWRWIREVKILKMVVMRGATTAAVEGVGPPGPLPGDFPVAWGLTPIQSVKWSSGDGAPPARLPRRRRLVAEGLDCLFFVLVGLSVRLP